MAVESIQEQADRLYQVAIGGDSSAKWIDALEGSDLKAVVLTLGRLGSTGATGAKLDALRDSARLFLEARLFDRLIDTLIKLDKSASRLTIVGIVATVIVGLAGLVVFL